MKATDWREVGPEVVAPLYAAERARWMQELDWDSAMNWVLIEATRANGSLPGFVVLDQSGAVAGWAFYFLHEHVLQIGGLTGRTTSVARCLLERRTSPVSCFLTSRHRRRSSSVGLMPNGFSTSADRSMVPSPRLVHSLQPRYRHRC